MFGTDERGSTSVMGNVMIIVIVVVLASTLAVAFFDTGDEATEEPPSADLDLSFDQGNDIGFAQNDYTTATGSADVERLTLTHNGGIALKSLYVHIRIGETDVRDSGCLTFTGSTPSTLESGDSLTVASGCAGQNNLDTGEPIEIVYNDPNSEKVFMLTEGEVP